jgi:hypothetical protein
MKKLNAITVTFYLEDFPTPDDARDYLGEWLDCANGVICWDHSISYDIVSTEEING